MSSSPYHGSPSRMAFQLDVDVWLETLDLEEYSPIFKPYGNVKEFLHWTEKNLLDLGIRNAAHRARLVSNLVYIREKLKRTSVCGAGLPPLATPPRSPRCVPPSGTQSPASPSRLQFRYSAIPEDQLTKTPPSPIRTKMSILDMSPDDLRRQLEEEFRLPSEDVRSHAWFHGGISREKADRLIKEDGDFLVRDSISKPGNFVLTVRWKDASMHFVVNKVVLKPHSPYASVQYQFEKECFDTIPSLIKFYVGNCRPVSEASGAVIQRPVNRNLPLSYTDNKYAATNKVHPGPTYIYGHLQRKVVTPRRGSMNGTEGLRQRSGSNPTPGQVNGGGGGGLDKQVVNRADSHPLLLGRVSPSERAASPSPLLRDQACYGRAGSEPILSPSREYMTMGHQPTGPQQAGPIESDYAETKPCLNPCASDDDPIMYAVASSGGSSLNTSPVRAPSISPSATQERLSPEATESPTPSIEITNSEPVPIETDPAASTSTASPCPSPAPSPSPEAMSLSKPYVREHIYSEIDHPDGPVDDVTDPADLDGVKDTIAVRYTMLHDEDSSPVAPPVSVPIEPSQTETDGQNLDVKPRKRVNSGTRFSVLESDYSRVAQRASPNHLDKKVETLQTILPVRETESVFVPQEFSSSLLEAENKPLDKACLDTIRQMLLDSNPLALARHLTLIDTEVCRIGHGLNNNSLPGLELLCLPHGARFRLDILERHNSLKMFCMASLLTCDDLEVRVQVLHQWIQLAETLRGSLGNLFSFATIMDALVTKQIVYLRSTWDQLRSRFTNTAVNYDTKLRSLLKSLNAGENVVPLTKTSLPHIMPIVRLLDRDWATVLDRDWSQPATKDVLDSVPSGESWEGSAPSYGLDILLGHMQNAHMLSQQTTLYRINAQARLAKHPPQEGLLDVFRTELHLRLLWGSRATTDNAPERYRLLEQVLSIMSQKLEFSGNSV